LKPAYEPILCFRKPRPGTYADCALEHGTGSLNIDGCRIGTESTERTANKPGVLHYGGSNHRPHHDGPAHHRTTGGTSGRWPANLLLSHEASCVRVGSKRVRGQAPIYRREAEDAAQDDGQIYGAMNPQPANKQIGYADADGLEEVADWECSASCPVRLLGEQSGERPSRGAYTNSQKKAPTPNRGMMMDLGASNRRNEYANQTGTAARFFQQFEWCEEPLRFRYEAKASRRERDAGLEGLPYRDKYSHTGQWNSHECFSGTTGDAAWRAKNPNLPKRNPHPTVKPIALCRYLAALICPPEPYLDDAALLVPYAGVGSECIGAILAGWRNLTAIELEPEYCEIWRARVGWWAHMHALTGESEPKAILDAARKIEKEGAVQMAMEDVHGH